MAGQFRHGGNPALRTCFGTVVATWDDAENEKFTRQRSRGRIDSAVGATMALGRVLAAETGPTVYERRPEFLFV